MTPKKDRKSSATTSAPPPTTQTPQATAAKPQSVTAKPVEAKPEAATKQTATFNRLREAWLAKGVDLSKLTTAMQGKNLNIQVAEGWPLIVLGASGGITLPTLRSYPSGFEAAVNGLSLYEKQQARDSKREATTPATAAKPSTPAPARA